eukprot:scaffold12215_cov17-Tisochrysis_lutea.AAC.1
MAVGAACLRRVLGMTCTHAQQLPLAKMVVVVVVAMGLAEKGGKGGPCRAIAAQSSVALKEGCYLGTKMLMLPCMPPPPLEGRPSAATPHPNPCAAA